MNNRFEIFTTQIAKVSRFVRKIKTAETAEFNLKSTHVSCLYYLYKYPAGLTARELSDICDEDKAAISRSVEYLEHQGLIKANAKTEKRWKSALLLTEAGSVVAKGIATKVDKIVEVASYGLTEENRKIFYESLQIICENLQKLCENYQEEK